MKGTIQQRQEVLSRLYPHWEKRTIWDAFDFTVNRVPQDEFLVVEGQGSFTYEQVRQAALAVASGLWAQGIRPGDHVAIQASNRPEQIYTALALAALCAVKIPINTHLGERELCYVLQQSEAEYFITDRGWAPCPDKDLSKLKKVIAMEGAELPPELHAVAWKDMMQSGAGETFVPNTDGHEKDPSDIIYTSGSTSAPKGVLLSHDMLLRSAFASCMNRGFELGRRVFVPLPMFHVYGYVEGLLTTILVGGTILMRNGKFQVEPVLDFMESGRANDILSVPSQMAHMVLYLREHPRKLPDLHAVYCSASVCPTWVWPGIRETLGVDDVITGYGMSEVCGASMQTSPMDSNEILESRVGKLLPGGCAGFAEFDGHQIQYRVIEPQTEEDVPEGEFGELWCRGPVLTYGYYNRPDINEKVFTKDGWFRTGDCGRFDENGYLILCGRMDDMYKINGENVSPKFLEDTMSECPVITKIEIVGVPDDIHGFAGAAFVQLEQDTPEHRAEAEEFAHKHLAKFQVPKYFFYISDQDWPRTATGKVRKPVLRKQAAAWIAELHAPKLSAAARKTPVEGGQAQHGAD